MLPKRTNSGAEYGLDGAPSTEQPEEKIEEKTQSKWLQICTSTVVEQHEGGYLQVCKGRRIQLREEKKGKKGEGEGVDANSHLHVCILCVRTYICGCRGV